MLVLEIMNVNASLRRKDNKSLCSTSGVFLNCAGTTVIKRSSLLLQPS